MSWLAATLILAGCQDCRGGGMSGPSGTGPEGASDMERLEGEPGFRLESLVRLDRTVD
jgi:hypothetical protein